MFPNMRRPRLARVVAAGAAALLTAGAAACSSGGGSSSSTPSASGTPTTSASSSAVQSGGSMTFAIDQDFAGFNINNFTDAQFVLQEAVNNTMPQAYLTTDKLAEQLDTDYVTSVKVTSTNPQTIVYTLNPKAVWSDGVPINAADYIYLWHALSGDPKYKDVGGKAYTPASTAGYNQIKSVTGSNGGFTVTVVFAKPFGDWQSLFGDIMPAHIASKVGFNNGFQTFNSNVQVSGGPFMMQSYSKGQNLVEVPNPKWWGAPVHLTKLVFKIIQDDNQMPPALQNGEVDALSPAQPSLQFKDAVQGIPNVTTDIIPGLEFQHMDFNQANPYLAKLGVRQAIMAGFNRAQMVQRIVGPVSSTITPLGNRIYLPGQPQFQDTSAGAGDFNVAKAKSLLAAAGMKMGSDGYYQPTFGPESGKDFTLSISTTSGNPVRAEIEQLFQADMKNIGLKINIQNYSADQLFGTVGPKSEFDIIEFAWVATPFASSNQPIYCSYTNAAVCGENWDHYSNKQVDSLFNTALATVDTTKAAAIYNQIDTLLWKDAATLPLYQQPQLYSYGNKFVNIKPNPSSVGFTWNAFEWGVKAS
jgi:peptide/nickel transport system substrate-binding protein